MLTVGRLKDGDLLMADEVNERIPAVTDGLIAHYPFDGIDSASEFGYLYKNDKLWDEPDYINAGLYPLKNVSAYGTVVQQAQVYIRSIPTERFTILQSSSMYLSIDANLKVSVYKSNKVQVGYHASNKTLNLNQWYTLTHISTTTETIIMIDGEIDKVLANANTGTVPSMANTFIGAESASRRFNGLIKNIRIGISDPRPKTNTSTSYQPNGNGLNVEPPITNHVLTVANSEIDNAWTADTAGVTITVSDEVPSLFGNKVSKWSKSVKSANGNVYVNGGTKFTSTLSDVWTFSCYVRRADGKPVTSVGSVYLYVNGLASWSEAPDAIVDCENGWYRIIKTRSGIDIPRSLSLVGFSSLDGTTDWYFDGLQLEASAYANSYVDSTRPKGIYLIPFDPQWVSSGTLVWKASLNTIISSGQKSLGMQWSTTGGAAGHFGVKFDSSTKRFLTMYAGTANYSLAQTIDTNEHTYIFTYTQGGSQRLYMDGVKIIDVPAGTHDDLNRKDGVFPVGLSGWTYLNEQWDGSIKSFSIYGKVLDDKEIVKLSKETLSINGTGTLQTTKLIEATNSIPDDAIVYPLEVNSRIDGTSNAYSMANSESNIVYEDGSAWVGDATTNLWTGLRYNNTTGTGTVTRDTNFSGPFQGIEVAKVETATPGTIFSTILWTVGGITGPNVNYYHSVYVWLEEGTYVGLGQHWNPWTLANVNKRYIPKKTWTRIYVPNTTVDDTHVSVGLEYCTDGIAYFTAPQYEKKGFMTPFVNGTRSASDIKFPLDFSVNQSFVFWTKLNMADSDILGQSTSPNIFEIGTYYANSSLTLWYWGSGGQPRVYGKQDADASWTMAGTPMTYPFVDSKYRNKWHQYAVTLSGSGSIINTINISVDGVNVFTRTGLTITSWNGSFFGMGAHGGARPNAYYRDLIKVNRTLSDTEIKNMYKAQIRQKKKSLNIRGTIQEDTL